MKKNIPHLTPAAGYDLHAEFYDAKLGYLNGFEQNQLLPLLGNVKNKTILDVGAGTGRLAVKLINAGATLTALDASGQILKILHQKNTATKTIIADAENLPFPDNSFDIIIAAFLIVHLKNPALFFQESYRVLKQAGQFVLTNINQKKPPAVKIKNGLITIESYYHRPEKIITLLEKKFFQIQKNIFIRDKDVWQNQIILAVK